MEGSLLVLVLVRYRLLAICASYLTVTVGTVHYTV
ncbi:Uncharacterised protein [Mycobacteroides abscessus subsp. abscessus]|nr:Uncharacterised protein [Mycobacteroides abscessus subsp. abscessus]